MKIRVLYIISAFLTIIMFNGCMVDEPDDIYDFAETAEDDGGNDGGGGGSTVNFYGTPRNPLAGETVYFTNTSQSGFDGFYWEFGDGQTSSSNSPSHTYSENGVYNVSLTGYYVTGEEVTETKNEYVVVGWASNVTADFYADKTSVEPGEIVYFTSTSTGPVDSYYWDFGDGVTSSEYDSNPSHTYYSEGVYTVSLTVYDPGSGSDIETKTGYIVVESAGGSSSYCNSYGGSSYEWINNFVIGSQSSFISGNDGGYGDYTNTEISLQTGQSQYIYIEPGYYNTEYSEYFKVWIDFNKDGDFNDSGELVASGSANGAVDGYIDIPSSNGTTRLRVAMKRNSYSDPCDVFSYGEVEDYTVILSSKKQFDGEIKYNGPVELKPVEK